MQEAADYGQTDSDNDIDSNSPRAGASGPGPPDSRAGGGSKGGGGVGGGSVGAGGGGKYAKKRARSDGSCSSREMSERGEARRGGGESEEMAALPDASGGEVGGGENSVRGARGSQDSMKRPLSGGLQALLVPPPKMRLDRVKPDAKEVRKDCGVWYSPEQGSGVQYRVFRWCSGWCWPAFCVACFLLLPPI